MTTDEVILYFVVNAFETEIIRRSMIIFFQKPRGKFMCVFAYVLRFIIAVISHWLDNSLAVMLVSAVTIGFISAQYEGSIKRKIYSTSFTFALMYLCEFLIGMIDNPSSNGSLLNSSSPDLHALIVSKLLNFMIVLIVKKLCTAKGDNHSASVNWSAVILVPISTAVLEISVICSTQSMLIIILSAVIVLFMNAFIFYLFDKLSENYRQKAELAKVELEKEIYYNQCVNVMNSQEALRQFRHDINNQLEMIKVLLDKGETIELKKQVCGLLANDNKNEPICFTGNVAVDGILNYKLEKIKQCGAEIETNLEIPRQTFMNTKDLTLILGNLLDNMIDALTSTQKNKHCFVQMKYSKSRLFICLKNTYENAVIYENGSIVSSKTDREAHGIGLKSVREVVEKYNGHMDISCDDVFFSVKIILLLPLDNSSEE